MYKGKISQTLHCKKGITGKTAYDLLKNYFEAGCPATYTKNGRHQCFPDRGRGFYDLLRLTRSKFHNISKEKVAHCLEDLCKIELVSGFYCADVKKVVFHNTKRSGYSDWIVERAKGWDSSGVKRLEGDVVSLNEFYKLLDKYNEK